MARLKWNAVVRSNTELNKILVQILEENGVERWEYSLDGYEDERHCIEKADGNWQVYFGERGQKRRCKSFETRNGAVKEFLKRLGRDEAQREALMASMDRLWRPVKLTPVANDKEYEFSAIVEPVAARPIALRTVDVEKAKAGIKAQLGRKDLPKGIAGKKGKAAMKFAAARKVEPKGKGVKTAQKIGTFGLKG